MSWLASCPRWRSVAWSAAGAAAPGRRRCASCSGSAWRSSRFALPALPWRSFATAPAVGRLGAVGDQGYGLVSLWLDGAVRLPGAMARGGDPMHFVDSAFRLPGNRAPAAGLDRALPGPLGRIAGQRALAGDGLRARLWLSTLRCVVWALAPRSGALHVSAACRCRFSRFTSRWRGAPTCSWPSPTAWRQWLSGSGRWRAIASTRFWRWSWLGAGIGLKTEGILWALTLVPPVIVALNRRVGFWAVGLLGGAALLYLLFGPAELTLFGYTTAHDFQQCVATAARTPVR